MKNPCRAASRAFGLRGGWERPLDRRRALKSDAFAAVILGAFAIISLDASVSLGSLPLDSIPTLTQYVIVLVPVGVFVFRRLAPTINLAFAVTHFIVVALFAPAMSPVFALQLYYVLSLYSSIAWAKERRVALQLTMLMLGVCLLWIASDVFSATRLSQLRSMPDIGPFPPVVAALIQVTLSTTAIFVAAIGAGLGSWWAARREALSRSQALVIAEQATELNMRALNHERLKIARELHDVVGHHVALTGIQLGVAQKVGVSDPELADMALTKAQRCSRDASSDLRLLLEALRSPCDLEEDVLVPSAGLAELRELAEKFDAAHLKVEVDISGPIESVPLAVVVCAHRVVREALTNVTRHSTATSSRLVVVAECAGELGSLDVQISDAGQARGDTTGSGLGLLGMTERVGLVGGTLTYGPTNPGFRVIAKFDWNAV